jgi:hypothetical protein
LVISKFQGQWVPRPDGALSLKEAKAFVRSRGVVIPRYLFWFVPEDEGLTLEESGLADADAMYYRIDQAPQNAGFLVYWNELLTNRGQITVFLRREVLRSDEHCLYVLSHEIFEIRELKRVFLQNGGALTFRRLCNLIDPQFHGAIHKAAVLHGDALVENLRKERGI